VAANALVQTRIDPGVKERAAAVLEQMGMTVSDAVRILLTRTANEGALPFPLVADAAAHDTWFRSKVGTRGSPSRRCERNSQSALCCPPLRRSQSGRGRMKIVWSLFAISDRGAIFDYIEADSPRAAARIDDQIEAQVDRLIKLPEIGRPGRLAGTRELVIQRTPYIAAYVIEDDIVRVLRVLHGAQQWPADLER
jgi:toxin ParE1/3/4